MEVSEGKGECQFLPCTLFWVYNLIIRHLPRLLEHFYVAELTALFGKFVTV
jgi:hypothetical protein